MLAVVWVITTGTLHDVHVDLEGKSISPVAPVALIVYSNLTVVPIGLPSSKSKFSNWALVFTTPFIL